MTPDNDEEFVRQILEQIRVDEERAKWMRIAVICCGLLLAWGCGALMAVRMVCT